MILVFAAHALDQPQNLAEPPSDENETATLRRLRR
jgi:hypothetical protein